MTFTIRVKPLTLNNTLDTIGNLCLYIFLFLTSCLFLYRYDHSLFLLRYLFLIGGAMAGYGNCLARSKYKYYKPFLFAFVLAACWVMSTIGQIGYQNYPLTDLFYTLCYIGLGLVILSNTYSHIISLVLYGFTSISILLRIVQNTDTGMILLANSRNYVSVLMLSTMMLYYISCHDKNKPILVTPVLIFFYVCIYATGRGGIIVSGFLTVALFLYKYFSIENKKVKWMLGSVIIIVLFTIIVYIMRLDESIINQHLNTSFSRFYTMGPLDSARGEIWSNFFHNNNESILAFLFGSDTFLAMTEGNLHNSFLQSYASFGLAGFIVILLFTIKAFINMIKTKDYFGLILFTAIVLRALTDRVFFQGYCEIYLYYFIFYHMYKKNEEKRRTRHG